MLSAPHILVYMSASIIAGPSDQLELCAGLTNRVFVGSWLSASGVSEPCVPRPQRSYLFKELYKETIIGNPKKVGYLWSRYSL